MKNINLMLKGRIIQKYGTIAAFSEACGKSTVAVSAKLNGKSSFSQKDIIEWSNLLDIASTEVMEYFFAP